MPLLETKGAASAQGFGGAGAGAGSVNYIEDVFSTYLYTGNGSTQTITNGIDLAGEGGLTWIKYRSTSADHFLFDTARGATNYVRSNNTGAQVTNANSLTSFNSDGFSLGSSVGNLNAATIVSWTFRKQPKFFDVVTYTGNGSNRTVSHNLGSVPGCIIVKRTNTTADWQVYHRSNANTQYMVLNSTAAVATGTTRWNSTTPTSTVFSLGTDSTVNASGGTYVAYLFAHDAGGFGLTGTDNVISCGSFTTNGAVQSINLGYEPQWLLFKNASTGGNWLLRDSMRGWPGGATATGQANLYPNLSNAEDTASDLGPTATGFDVGSGLGSGTTWIYIAIRRGPMKVPTSGTSVFLPTAAAASGTVTTNFPLDLQFYKWRNGVDTFFWTDRLRGVNSPGITSSKPYLDSAATTAETNALNVSDSWNNTGFNVPAQLGLPGVLYSVRRAPGFFDEVCFTGTGAAMSVNHNLGVVPELTIMKPRGVVSDWLVNYDFTGSGAAPLGRMYLNLTNQNFGAGGITGASASTFDPSAFYYTLGQTQVVYLFATCPGVSKVGSYTGTGALQTVNCGFTGGARFVLIKRTDSTGDWWVYDSARGISASNDPYLFLNSTAAEVTGTNYVDTDSTGFKVTAAAPAGLNANGGTYIFLAIA